MGDPLFRKVDCMMIKVADLEAAVAFYSDRLGHAIVWRTPDAVGLAMPDTDAELVLHARLGPEVDLLVENVNTALARFVDAGGRVVTAPFEIPIGRCAVVEDPFGNVLVMLDQTSGLLVTGPDRRVVSRGSGDQGVE